MGEPPHVLGGRRSNLVPQPINAEPALSRPDSAAKQRALARRNATRPSRPDAQRWSWTDGTLGPRSSCSGWTPYRPRPKATTHSAQHASLLPDGKRCALIDCSSVIAAKAGIQCRPSNGWPSPRASARGEAFRRFQTHPRGPTKTGGATATPISGLDRLTPAPISASRPTAEPKFSAHPPILKISRRLPF